MPGAGMKLRAAVLGVDPELDRVAADLRVVVPELLAGRDPEHLADQVDAGDLLGDAVLDLEPGVDLEEGDRAVLADEELARAGADVAGLAQDRLGGLVERVIWSSVRNGAGASSTSFWCRRCSEQSRVETTTTLPCWSARHWVSTWRGLSRNFSTKHSPRPNAETASRTADSKASATSSISRATLSPRPPPPNAALIAIGRPFSSANATASSASVERVLGAGRERGADLLGDVAGLDLVAEVLDRRRAAGRSRPGRRRSRPGRSRRSRRGSRSRGAPSRRRTSPRPR